MGTISKNFSYSEFEKSEVARRKGICNVIISFRVRDAIFSLVHWILQPLRDALGLPVIVSSGYRCPELNEDPEVGGAPDSQQEKGEAADIYVLLEDGSRMESVKVARWIVDLRLPFDQLIVYPTFVHVSHRLTGVQRGEILYNRSYHGPRV